jgi:hypothetical protein
VNQTACLIEIYSLRTFDGIISVVVKGLSNAVHLYRELDGYASTLELSGQRGYGRCAPTVAKSSMQAWRFSSFNSAPSPVHIQVQNHLIGFFDLTVFKRPDVNVIRILLAQSLDHMNFRMVRLII